MPLKFRLAAITTSSVCLFAASCSMTSAPGRIKNVTAFNDVAERHGEVPTCNVPGRGVVFLPGMGGDTVSIGRNRPATIIDSGDVDGGATLDVHDRVIFKTARPDQFSIKRVGSALAMCAPNVGVALVIQRQYCAGRDELGAWNNTIEEISFASGVTWLSDDLYAQYRERGASMTRRLLDDYQLEKASDIELSRWQILRMSDFVPPRGGARRICAAEQARQVDLNLDS